MFTVNENSLDDLITEEETMDNIAKIKKFERLFEEMKKFFDKNKIIIYGGTALDMHLPEESKIYDKNDFPDFDCYSTDPKKHSEQLANILTKLNYKYIEIKYAMHDGTYKLYCDFVAIADLTKVSVSLHRKLFDKSEKIDGYHVTSIRHLKSSAYKELAVPKSSLFRWKKILSRVKLMETEFKNNRSAHSQKSIQRITFNDKINKLIPKFKDYAITKDLVLSGNDAVEYYLGLPRGDSYMITTSSGLFQCISTEPAKTVAEFRKMVEKMGFKKITVEEVKNTTIGDHTRIYVNYFDDMYTFQKIKLNVVTVYSAEESCFSYEEYDDTKFASIFYVLHILYHVLHFNDDRIDRTNIKNIINSLIKKITIDRFKTKCYGYHLSNEEVRRDRWDNNKKVVFLRMA